ncbi:MAG: DEAD/DEAH box helicase [Bacillaceae bacterium]|nr:DEAD/DEAH box helicase [Bacillaceae bacterium]
MTLIVQEVKAMNKYVVVDVETTGNSPKNGDKIIQIGLVVIEEGKIVDRFSSFVQYDDELSPFIENLTGIQKHQLLDAPSFCEIAPTLMNFFHEAIFVAHNVMFDLTFIQSELEECGYNHFSGPVIDTVELSRLLLPTEESYKLNQLAMKLKIDHERPHQADSDAEVTAELLIFLLNKLDTLPLLTLQRLKPIIHKLNPGLEEIIISIINKKLTCILIDDDRDEFRQIALIKKQEKVVDEPHDIPDFAEEIENLEQRLSQVMKGYEVRLGQKEMMETINESLQTNHHLLIEAGTGTGKSLGYLFPSIYYAKKHDQPVVISTHTVQLQQQLLERDIQFLKRCVPFPVHYAVLKGRNHYLCLRKFEQQLETLINDNYDTLFSKGQILIWLTETNTGDVEELNLPSGGSMFWKDVQNEASSCIGRHCPWFSRCFYHRARQDAYNADIIITNHALLFTDLISENQLLPGYKQVVIDEAHQIEDIASDFFGIRADYFSIVHLLNRLGNSYTNDLLKKVVSLSEELQVDITDCFEQLDKDLVELKFELDQFFSQLHQIVYSRSSKQDLGRVSMRYRPDALDNQEWVKAKEVLHRLIMYFHHSFKSIKRIVHELELFEHDLDFMQNGVVTNFKGIFTTLKEEKGKLEQLFLEFDQQFVYWLEIDAKGAKNADIHL